MRVANVVKIKGIKYGTSEISTRVRKGVLEGRIACSTYIVKEGDRLDTIAGAQLGDAGNWWAIAAASGIGWGLQVPPGTLVRLPDMGSVVAMVFARTK